eukprot:5835701-Prymnesium_polylepis.3
MHSCSSCGRAEARVVRRLRPECAPYLDEYGSTAAAARHLRKHLARAGRPPPLEPRPAVEAQQEGNVAAARRLEPAAQQRARTPTPVGSAGWRGRRREPPEHLELVDVQNPLLGSLLRQIKRHVRPRHRRRAVDSERTHTAAARLAATEGRASACVARAVADPYFEWEEARLTAPAQPIVDASSGDDVADGHADGEEGSRLAPATVAEGVDTRHAIDTDGGAVL